MSYYQAVATAIIARLQGHNVTGGYLSGFVFESKPIQELLGRKDWPMVVFQGMTVTEETHNLRVVKSLVEMQFVLCTDASAGWPEHGRCLDAFLNALDRVPGGLQDTLGLNIANVRNASLSDQNPLDISIRSLIVPTIVMNPTLKGER